MKNWEGATKMPRDRQRSGSTPGEELRTDCIRAALEFERDLARLGAAPDIRRLPHFRARPLFELLGAVFLALGVAGMSLAGSFVLFNVILHLEF
jgi:hypothetical protein